jgi:tetratricopeptide (TPR) repeat protein
MRAGVYLCLLASSCLAQSGYLEGELLTQKPTDLSHVVVRLETSNPSDTQQTTVSLGGDFRFTHLAQGNYTLVVADELGHEIAREQLNYQPSNPPLRVQLPEESGAERPGGSVSVSQLRHRPDPRAWRAAAKAQKLSDSGDHRGAAAQLEKAVAIDPQYAEAYGNLGAQYVRLGQPERAAAEFRRSIALDPQSAVEQANLALALAQLHQIAEALQQARRALQVDSTNPLAHYVLGCIMANDASARAEAIRHLELASRSLPMAETTLAALLGEASTGQR